MIHDHFTAPYSIHEVRMSEDSPAIYVLKDSGFASVGGFENQEIADGVCAALNDHADFRALLQHDAKFKARWKFLLGTLHRGRVARDTP